MFAKILFFPLLIVVVLAGLLATLRVLGGRLDSRGTARMAKLALLAAALSTGGLWQMYGIDESWAPWAAVGLLAVVVVPVFIPVGLLLLAVLSAKLSGKPIRWN